MSTTRREFIKTVGAAIATSQIAPEPTAMGAADRRVFVDPRQFYLVPSPSAGLVNVLQEIDHDRFKKLFVDLMTKPIRKP